MPTKLTFEQALEIKKLVNRTKRARGKIPRGFVAKTANQYKVCKDAVSRIISGKSWKNAPYQAATVKIRQKRDNGLCARCGEAADKFYCKKHADERNARERKNRELLKRKSITFKHANNPHFCLPSRL